MTEGEELAQLEGEWYYWLASPGRPLWPHVGQRIRLLAPCSRAGLEAVVTGFTLIRKAPHMGEIPEIEIDNSAHETGVLASPRQWEPAELERALLRMAHLRRVLKRTSE